MDSTDDYSAGSAQNYARAAFSGSKTGCPQPPRTLDGLGNIVGRLKGIRRNVESMLDRCSPSPREGCSDTMGQSLGAQPYAINIDDAMAEINAIDDLLSALERHV